MATRRASELDRFLAAPALPPRAIGRDGGGWTNYDVVVAVCGARGVHAVDAALYDAVALKYERRIETFAQAFAACLVGRRSLARLDLSTLQDCHPAFAALQLPESINDAQMAAEIGEWFARAAAEREETMKSKGETTVSGVCPKCRMIGVSIVAGKVQPHANGCDGIVKAAAAPRAAFVPRCTCGNKGTCRTCGIADAIVQAFFALRSPAARGIGAPTIAASSTGIKITVEQADGTMAPIAPAAKTVATAAAPRTVVARKPAPVAVAAPAADVKLTPLAPVEPSYERPVFVARAIVEAFQAARDAAHLSMVRELERAIAKRDAARLAQIDALQLQLDAARAGYAAQTERLHQVQAAAQATQAPAAAPLACYRCGEVKPMGYVLGGKVCCRDCRGAHSDEYHAARGTQRRPRRYDRGASIATMTVNAQSVTVAKS